MSPETPAPEDLRARRRARRSRELAGVIITGALTVVATVLILFRVSQQSTQVVKSARAIRDTTALKDRQLAVQRESTDVAKQVAAAAVDASVLLENNQTDEALTRVNDVLQRDSTNPQMRTLQALVRFRKNDLRGASEAVGHARQLDSSSATTFHLSSRISAALGDQAGARQDSIRARHLDSLSKFSPKRMVPAPLAPKPGGQ